MNAREMIARLQELDPETPIRYSYWDDYSPGDPEVVETVDCISDHGWLNDSDELYEGQNEFIRGRT